MENALSLEIRVKRIFEHVSIYSVLTYVYKRIDVRICEGLNGIPPKSVANKFRPKISNQ